MKKVLIGVAVSAFLAACAQPSRMGMSEDPSTGLLSGSAIERNIVLDASQLENRQVKVSLRNVSGDTAYDMRSLKGQLEDVLRGKGYKPTDGDDFGIKFDVNVLYSGHVSTNLAGEFGFLGGTAGALAGSQGNGSFRGAASGALVGATIGTIAGSYVRDETYIVVTEVTIAVADQYRGKTSKTITFSASPPMQEERRSSIKPFEAMLRTKVAVYAGGRNVSRDQISSGVKSRLARIISDAI